MCSFWNIPAISYMPTSTAVSDRNIYKTLARLSSKNTNSIAKAVMYKNGGTLWVDNVFFIKGEMEFIGEVFKGRNSKSNGNENFFA